MPESPRPGDRASPCTDVRRTGPEGRGGQWVPTLLKGKICGLRVRETFQRGAGGLWTWNGPCGTVPPGPGPHLRGSVRTKPASLPPPWAGPGGAAAAAFPPLGPAPHTLDTGSRETPLGQGFTGPAQRWARSLKHLWGGTWRDSGPGSGGGNSPAGPCRDVLRCAGRRFSQRPVSCAKTSWRPRLFLQKRGAVQARP